MDLLVHQINHQSSKRVKESKEEFETAVGEANLEKLYEEGVPKSNYQY